MERFAVDKQFSRKVPHLLKSRIAEKMNQKL